MKSLFVKLVAWFGVLLVFALAAFIGTTLYLNQGSQPDRLIAQLLLAQADDGVAALQSGGPQTLERYLANLDRHFLGRHRLLDASGRDVLSGEMHPARSTSRQKPPLRFFPPPRPILIQQASTDGHYRILIETPEPNFGRPNLVPYYFWIVAVILGVCYALAFNLVRPLRQLRTTLSRFGAGELSVRTFSRRHDEFGDLGRAFDGMAGRIQTLLNAERRLLQDVSHELRSPLARLTFAIEIARKAEDRNAALDRIKKEALRISEMVDELTRMTREDETRANTAVCITDIVNSVAEDCIIEADAKDCRLSRKVGDDVTVSGDPVLLRRSLENVVRNAIRYAPEGTPVEVTATGTGGVVELTVRDYGPGVPPQYLDDIFRPFFRVERDRSRTTGGVGLGLAIAQRAVRLHHGEIVAANANPGLRVTIRIPSKSK